MTKEQALALCDQLAAYIRGDSGSGGSTGGGTGGGGSTGQTGGGQTGGPVPDGVTVVDGNLSARRQRVNMVAGQVVAIKFSLRNGTDGVNLVSITARGADSGDRGYRFAFNQAPGTFDSPLAFGSGTGQPDVHFAVKPGKSPSTFYTAADQGEWYLNLQAEIADGGQADIEYTVGYPPGGL